MSGIFKKTIFSFILLTSLSLSQIVLATGGSMGNGDGGGGGSSDQAGKSWVATDMFKFLNYHQESLLLDPWGTDNTVCKSSPDRSVFGSLDKKIEFVSIQIEIEKEKIITLKELYENGKYLEKICKDEHLLSALNRLLENLHELFYSENDEYKFQFLINKINATGEKAKFLVVGAGKLIPSKPGRKSILEHHWFNHDSEVIHWAQKPLRKGISGLLVRNDKSYLFHELTHVLIHRNLRPYPILKFWHDNPEFKTHEDFHTLDFSSSNEAAFIEGLSFAMESHLTVAHYYLREFDLPIFANQTINSKKQLTYGYWRLNSKLTVKDPLQFLEKISSGEIRSNEVYMATAISELFQKFHLSEESSDSPQKVKAFFDRELLITILSDYAPKDILELAKSYDQFTNTKIGRAWLFTYFLIDYEGQKELSIKKDHESIIVDSSLEHLSFHEIQKAITSNLRKKAFENYAKTRTDSELNDKMSYISNVINKTKEVVESGMTKSFQVILNDFENKHSNIFEYLKTEKDSKIFERISSFISEQYDYAKEDLEAKNESIIFSEFTKKFFNDCSLKTLMGSDNKEIHWVINDLYCLMDYVMKRIPRLMIVELKDFCAQTMIVGEVPCQINIMKALNPSFVELKELVKKSDFLEKELQNIIELNEKYNLEVKNIKIKNELVYRIDRLGNLVNEVTENLDFYNIFINVFEQINLEMKKKVWIENVPLEKLDQTQTIVLENIENDYLSWHGLHDQLAKVYNEKMTIFGKSILAKNTEIPKMMKKFIRKIYEENNEDQKMTYTDFSKKYLFSCSEKLNFDDENYDFSEIYADLGCLLSLNSFFSTRAPSTSLSKVIKLAFHDGEKYIYNEGLEYQKLASIMEKPSTNNEQIMKEIDAINPFTKRLEIFSRLIDLVDKLKSFD